MNAFIYLLLRSWNWRQNAVFPLFYPKSVPLCKPFFSLYLMLWIKSLTTSLSVWVFVNVCHERCISRQSVTSSWMVLVARELFQVSVDYIYWGRIVLYLHYLQKSSDWRRRIELCSAGGTSVGFALWNCRVYSRVWYALVDMGFLIILIIVYCGSTLQVNVSHSTFFESSSISSNIICRTVIWSTFESA